MPGPLRPMVKRTIEISDDGGLSAHLSVENDQLVITRRGPGRDAPRVEVGRVPCQDIGYLILDSRALSLTHSSLTGILRHGGAVIVCDDTHTPAGLMLSTICGTALRPAITHPSSLEPLDGSFQ